MEIYSSQYAVMMEVIARTGVNVGEIAAIGITNQRETTILWDKATGQPIYNAIVWQCRRTAKIVEDLVAAGLGDHIKERTGLVPDAYFSGSKINGFWIMCQAPGNGPGAGRFIRHGGQLADLEAYRRRGPCYGLHKCLPHHAL